MNFFKPRSPLIFLIGFYLLLSGLFVATIPYGVPPDEETHFAYNVDFMLTHHRLPVSGVDDVDAYKACRNNDFGRQTCVNSYNVFPGFSYLVSAVSSSFFHTVFGLKSYLGARLAGVVWGLIFVVSIYLTSLEIAGSPWIAALVTLTFTFIPQVIFVSSYVNQDSHSLAISGLLGLTTVRFYLEPRRRTALKFGLAVGLLFSAKYNFFVFAPFCAAFLIYLLWVKKLDRKLFAESVLYCTAGAIVISGFWFIRNYILYQDPLGLSFAFAQMDKYHAPGTVRSFNLSSLFYLHDRQFFWLTARSAVAVFGPMTIYLTTFSYLLFFSVFAACFLGLIWIIIRLKDGRFWVGTSILFLFCLAVGFQHIWNSLKIDLQPQGRYLFHILVPLAIWISAVAKNSRLAERLLGILGLNTLWIILLSVVYIVSNYGFLAGVTSLN